MRLRPASGGSAHRSGSLALIGAACALLLAPMGVASAGPTLTGTLSGGVFPGSAVRNVADTFSATLTANGLSNSQTVKSVLITLPPSGWSFSGPSVGVSNGAGWAVQSRTATSICWGGRAALVSGSATQVSAAASTSAALGPAAWTAKAFGDTSCRHDVKPALAQPETSLFIAVAETGGHCAAGANCSTNVIKSGPGTTSVAITGTGTSDKGSFVSASLLDQLPAGIPDLTCPEIPSYDPDLGSTAQTLVTGGARTHEVQLMMAKELVNLVSDNGASRMDVCLRSEQPFATKYGGLAAQAGTFELPGTDTRVPMYDGFVPRCGVPAEPPCILDQYKRNGDMVWNIILPPGDPLLRP